MKKQLTFYALLLCITHFFPHPIPQKLNHPISNIEKYPLVFTEAYQATNEKNKNDTLICPNIDSMKISFMGSSVMYGTGADNLQGYAYQFNELLKKRTAKGSPAFYRSNVSVPGDNTQRVMKRFEKEGLGDCSAYIIFGLALGNEGVHENGQAAFDSYKNNLLTLIQKAKSAGKKVLVVNSYGRGDFNEKDYNLVKQLNLLIHEWDLPSINSLGIVRL